MSLRTADFKSVVYYLYGGFLSGQTYPSPCLSRDLAINAIQPTFRKNTQKTLFMAYSWHTFYTSKHLIIIALQTFLVFYRHQKFHILSSFTQSTGKKEGKILPPCPEYIYCFDKFFPINPNSIVGIVGV
jgi:hypothetical protein